jgi:hypothetical protein
MDISSVEAQLHTDQVSGEESDEAGPPGVCFHASSDDVSEGRMGQAARRERDLRLIRKLKWAG